jgi:hypothetical protein
MLQQYLNNNTDNVGIDETARRPLPCGAELRLLIWGSLRLAFELQKIKTRNKFIV